MRLLGVEIEAPYGLIGTSDADVAAHAVADALLGAAALGDLGDHFPSSDPRWHGADSMELLTRVAGLIAGGGFSIVNVDVTIIIEEVRVAPYRDAMRRRLADSLGLEAGNVSVKATTTDRLGPVGDGAAAAAQAVALLGPQGGDG